MTIIKTPWLSVLMPIYNGGNFLASALDSIVRQKDNDIEVIAVDGQSSDDTLSILDSYKNKIPIQIISYKQESNWVMKTNHALSLATGEFTCFLHHDDFWLGKRLQVIKQLTQQFPDVALITHPSYFIDSANNNLGPWTCPLPTVPTTITPNMMIEALLIQNFISIIAPVFKRELAIKVGGLDENLWYTADWDFWIKLATCGHSIYYPNPLAGFRIHPNSQTITRSSGAKDFQNQLELVLRRHITSWDVPEIKKNKIKKVANFSISVNSALANTIHQNYTDFLYLFYSFLLLGPRGAYQYIVTSRIWERAMARLRAQIIIRRSVTTI